MNRNPFLGGLEGASFLCFVFFFCLMCGEADNVPVMKVRFLRANRIRAEKLRKAAFFSLCGVTVFLGGAGR